MFGRILGVIITSVGAYIGWFGIQVMLSGVLPAFIIVMVGIWIVILGVGLIAGLPLKDIIGDFFIRAP